VILTVDLAAKFSAACVMDENGKVYWEGRTGSWGMVGWATVLAEIAKAWEVNLILVEDVPYGISSQKMTKDVTRLQGMLIAEMWRRALLDKVFFVNPSTWQKTFPGVARGKPEERIEAARVAAEKLGYKPPDLVQQYIDSVPEGTRVLKKHTNPLAKQMTDHIDAFLIGQWAIGRLENIRTLTGVQPAFA
jgi:hypothetical protein